MFGSTKKMTPAQLQRETKCDSNVCLPEAHLSLNLLHKKKGTISWCEVAIGRENIKVLWLDLPSVTLNSISKVVKQKFGFIKRADKG